MRKRDWIRKQMRKAKRTFLYLSPPSGRKETRTCVICGTEFEVLFYSFFRYEGGHYFFGKGNGIEHEYWECDKCFEEDDS